MRGVHFFIFLVTLPLIAAIGFDCYLWYEHQDKGFEFSTPGYIWTQYDPESYKWTVENAAPEVWAWINLTLGQKSVAVGAAFAAFFYLLVGALKLMGVGGEGGVVHGNASRLDEITGKKTVKFKYKRK